VGLSVGCEVRVESLSAAIRSVRRASLNRSIGVMVGGPLFNKFPELVGQVGADASARDGRTAVQLAEGLAERGAKRI
jgi:methanogenic corrinoid protein MtbC1